MASLSNPGVASIPPTPTIKLRGSCHACALSKLKCSQDKPTCARCTKRGTACQYLASKRAGRKQGSRTGSNNPTKSVNQPKPSDEGDDRKNFVAASTQLMHYALQQDRSLDSYRGHPHHQRTPSYPDSVPSLLSSAGPTTPLTFSHSDFESFLSSPVSLSMLDVPEVDYFAGAEINFRDLNDFPDPAAFLTPEDSLPMPEDNLSKSSPVPESQTLSTDMPSSPPSIDLYTPANILQCSCFSRSLALLRELFPNHTACCTTSSQKNEYSTNPPPTIQQVITQNEKTVTEIGQILDCYCSQDGYTLTIITLTVLKVLAWYGAVAQESRAAGEQQIHAEQIDRAPVVIGSYHLNGDEQSRMAAQLVLSELHRVQRVVNTLSERLKSQGLQESMGGRPDGTCLDGHESVLPVHLLDQLAADLRARLRGLSGQIVDRLRRS
ncbi:aflatoxin regulatory protein-domain-containing protein [Aspergillus pseudodeflectus]|uniref:Aflatoxin regulatory protein-domain-containing protein n=1 Tax=Aspergillus pseudodeflectus TaxID=176178 RepID=A0ABR4KN06_9EURO